MMHKADVPAASSQPVVMRSIEGSQHHRYLSRERFNHTLTDMLVTTAKEHLFEWKRHLQKVCFAYNTSVHASTGQVPFFLMFGQ